jgi:ubiquinone biosynthesis protein
MDSIRPIIDRELVPHLGKFQVQINPTSLAEASVAVVVPCTWVDPQATQHGRQHAVLKVLKPGIESDLQEDLDILARLADHLDAGKVAADEPAVEYREVFDEVRSLLLHEIRVEREQANLRVAARRYIGQPDVVVPALLPFSTPRVTAMQRVFGVKATELPHNGHRQLAHIIARRLIADVLFSRDAQTMFHADPHAGNLFACDDKRLAILDWSLVGHLHREQLVQMSLLSAAALMRNAAEVAQAIERIATTVPRPRGLLDHVDSALAELGHLSWPGAKWVLRLLDQLALAGIRFPPQLLLFRKVYFTLEGVVSDVSPDCSLQQLLTQMCIERFFSDAAVRPFMPFHSRDLATHLSNADLARLMGALPLSLARLGFGACDQWTAWITRTASGYRPT